MHAKTFPKNKNRFQGCADFTNYLAAPGMKESDLMPDFFLDLDTTPKEPIASVPNPGMAAPAAAAPPAAAPAGKTVQSVFDKLGGLINDELVSKVNAVYTFKVKGKNGDVWVAQSQVSQPNKLEPSDSLSQSFAGGDEGVWHLDLKNAPGASAIGEPPVDADVTFSLKDADFHKMFEGSTIEVEMALQNSSLT